MTRQKWCIVQHNDYMTGEVTYKYYNDMMWPERFATCVSVNEAIKMLE